MKLKLYNSLPRKVEEFRPLGDVVKMYTCGPTVYDYAHIGNFRTYVTSDILHRALLYFGFKVDFIMNITDVGHLTGDNTGDADTGEDKMERGARREGKTAQEISGFYAQAFYKDYQKLNLLKPKKFVLATEHVEEQIEMVKKLEEKGLAYKSADGDGIYFDTKKYEELTGNRYGELSDLDQKRVGARTWVSPAKKNSEDFALWKFSGEPGRRHMEWESPWGLGYPGWHLECSAMSIKYLGEQLDVHAGGVDLKQTHHPNEIAQSEALTGKRFVRYWLHGAHLSVDGGRMGKSLGNAYNLHDIEKEGFDPLALRYFYFSAHYRDSLNFTWQALEGAQNALDNLRTLAREYKNEDASKRRELSDEKLGKVKDYKKRFDEALASDLNMPRAVAAMWEMLKSNIPNTDKLDLLYTFDEVLGIGLRKIEEVIVPDEVLGLAKARQKKRKAGKFDEADALRVKIEEHGFSVKDTGESYQIVKK